MAIRREPCSQIHVDRVIDRREILIRLGAFTLRWRRSVTTMTIYLPGCPLSEIHHWGVVARSEIEDRPDTEPPIINLIASIEAEKARKKAREKPLPEIRFLDPEEGQQIAFIGGAQAAAAVRKRDDARKNGPAIGRLLSDSSPIG